MTTLHQRTLDRHFAIVCKRCEGEMEIGKPDKSSINLLKFELLKSHLSNMAKAKVTLDK